MEGWGQVNPVDRVERFDAITSPSYKRSRSGFSCGSCLAAGLFPCPLWVSPR